MTTMTITTMRERNMAIMKLLVMMVMKAIFVAFTASTGATAFNLLPHIVKILSPTPHADADHHNSLTQLSAVNDDNNNIEHKMLSRRSALSSFLAAGAAAASIIGTPVSNAQAAEGSRTIGQISGSGLVFKDTLVVESFDDPKVKGVTLYVSNFERPLTERLQKDFFNEPSYASVTCVKTGKIEIAENIDKSEKGEPVFEEKRSLLFKELRVQRIYDEEKKTMVYVSFNTRLDKNSDTNKSRFKSSICALSVE